MANAESIILHQFKRSPYSEKIRLALRLKELAWVAVDVPPILPKPDLMPLTGGYRRTPVLQIGADIYCDTSVMLMELEKRFQASSLDLPGHRGLDKMVAAWTDGRWFQTSVGVIFGAIGEHLPPEFIEDRSKMSGRPFNVGAMKAAAPFLRDQWRTQLIWVEERLNDARRTGAGGWLAGSKPGLIDVHAFMNPWFVEKNVPDFLATCFEVAPLAKDWFRRFEEIKGQAPEAISGTDAVEIAQGAEPISVSPSTADDLRDFKPGDRVAVAPDDYGKDWVEGDLVFASAERVVIARQDERAGRLHVHFPRVGYVLRALDAVK